MGKQNETYLVVTITSCFWVDKSKRCILHLILANSLEYPQRIRVASVFELFFVCLLDCLFSVCLFVCLFVFCLIVGNFSNFLNFNVLYCTIKYYSVPKQYSGVYWPAPPKIHRGLEWPQCLNCSVFFVLCLSSNFLIF